MRLSLLYVSIASYLPAMLEPYGSGHMIIHTSWWRRAGKMVIVHKSPLSSPTYVNIWWEYCIGVSCLDIPLAYPILIRYFKGFISPVFGLKAQMNPTSYHMELDLRFTLLNRSSTNQRWNGRYIKYQQKRLMRGLVCLSSVKQECL